jgi:hypothetical protein
MSVDLRKEEYRKDFILKHGRLPTKKERNTLRSVIGMWKKKHFFADKDIVLETLLEIMKIK